MSQEVSSPAVAKTFGIIHLVYFGIFFLFSLYGLYSLFLASPASQDNPVAQEMSSIQHELMTIPSVKAYFIGAQVVGFILLAVLLVAGIQLLMRKPLGRILSLAYAWASIVTGILSTVLYMLLVQSTYTELLAASSIPEQALAGIQVMSKAQPVLMFCCSALYPILILIFLLPEKFARSLTATTVEPEAPLATDPPVEPPAAPQE
jgi:hypothetical protein